MRRCLTYRGYLGNSSAAVRSYRHFPRFPFTLPSCFLACPFGAEPKGAVTGTAVELAATQITLSADEVDELAKPASS